MGKNPNVSQRQSKKERTSHTASLGLVKPNAFNPDGKPLGDSEETPAWYNGRCGKLVGTFIILSMFGFGVWFATHVSDVQTAIEEVRSAILGDDLNEAVKSVLSIDTDMDSKVDVNIIKRESQNGKKLYAKKEITNAADMKIRGLLDKAESALDEGQENEASKQFDDILRKYPKSPRAIYGKARVLYAMAEKQRSNKLLEGSIETCVAILTVPDVPKKLLIVASKFCVDRQSFRGWHTKALNTLRHVLDVYPDETEVWNYYGEESLTAGKTEEARNALLTALKLDPQNGFAMVLLGFILKSTDRNYEAAIPLLQKGIESNAPGVMDGRNFHVLGDALYKSGRRDEAYSVYRSAYEKGLFLSEMQRSLYNVDRLTARPWWTVEQTGQAKELNMIAKHWKEIRDEGLSNLNEKGLFVLEAEDLTDKGDWKQLTLFQQGRQNAANCKRAPKTCSFVQNLKDATGCTRGQIKFSVMQPGVHVWPHCGPTNCRIRAHLGLVVPEGPRIRVGNETRTWKEGEFILFDDSFEHEVWHDGDSMRLILIVDIWHPELSDEEKRTLPAI